jgi:thioredoxin 1
MNLKSFSLLLTAAAAFSGIAGAQEKEPAAGAGRPASPPQIQAAGGPAGSNNSSTKKLPRLVDLGADKCVPCKMMAPILEGLKKEYGGRMDVEFIDVWKTPGAGKEYGVRVIPTQIFYGTDGKESFRHEGFFGKEDILAKWKALGVDLGSKPQ